MQEKDTRETMDKQCLPHLGVALSELMALIAPLAPLNVQSIAVHSILGGFIACTLRIPWLKVKVYVVNGDPVLACKVLLAAS